MKKYIPYILITILLMIASSGATYIILNNKYNKQSINEPSQNNKDKTNENDKSNTDIDNENNVNKDSVKLVATKNNNGKITESFEIILNGKKNTFTIDFSYEIDNTLDVPGHILKGVYNNEELYYSCIFKDITKSEYFNINKIREYFNESNFVIIKGTDNKNYLALVVNGNKNDVLMYLYDEDMQLITDANLSEANSSMQRGGTNAFVVSNFYNSVSKLEEDKEVWYKNTFNFQYNTEYLPNINVKIEDNKIHYLVSLRDSETNTGELEERVYTINNNKLEYKTINKYHITEFGNVTS